MQKLLILSILVSHAVSDYCVRYTFEEDFENLFTSNTGDCSGTSLWTIGQYEDIDISGQNDRSTKFIFPQRSLSCVQSFTFPVTSGGIFEINMYMETALTSDAIIVLVMRRGLDGRDTVVVEQWNSQRLPDTFVPGWHTMKLIMGQHVGDFEGFLMIMGMASTSATVLVDSFRYIPPGMDEIYCELYHNATEITTEWTTESTAKTTIENATETTTETITTEVTAGPITESTAVSENEANTDSVHTTELPTTLPDSDDSDDSFWTPLRLKILVGLSVFILILSLLCVTCYCCLRSPVSVIVVKS